MSVPKGKRTTSKFEVFYHATKLRTEITRWLLRDFGIKPTVRMLPELAKRAKMTEGDATKLGELLDKYNLGDRVLEDFPSWWTAARRKRVDAILAELMGHITKANSIFATCEAELFERRIQQDLAIGCVYELLNEMQFIVSTLWRSAGADVNKFTPFIDMAETQIALLKAWRKSDNTNAKRLKAKG